MSVHVSCRYALLICSLPPLPPHPFSAKQTPLSRYQLDRRLALLDKEDARDLATIEEVIHWDRMPLQVSESGFVRHAQDALTKLGRPALREMLAWRLELRTLVAALRRRHHGLPAPARDETWGVGQCLDSIRRHWDHPAFNLGHGHPWIVTADQCLGEGRHADLEYLLFATVWDHYSRLAWHHHFDFEAVALYVLRWNLIERLARYEPAAATARFNALLIQGLGDFANDSRPMRASGTPGSASP